MQLQKMASNVFGDKNKGIQVGVNRGSVRAEIHQSHTIEDIDRFCLQNLRCPDSLVVKNRLKQTKDRLHRQSWEWILQTSQYQSWINGSDISLLWIKGGAGKGKTMMAIGLIEELSKQHENTVAYFFCENAYRELNTLESIIKGLILGLVKQHTRLNVSLRSRWDTQTDSFTEDCASWRNLWDILLEMLVSQCKLSNVYLVVDALDECQNGDMAEFLKLIVRNGLDQPKLKWLLTSRPLDSAERILLIGHEQTQVSLELNSRHISQAVKAYICHKVDELSSYQRYKGSLKSEIRTELSAKAEGVFLWVSLVCKKLENIPQEKALSTVQELPPGLHALYDRALDQLRGGETDDVNKCMRLLKVMMLLYRPLNVAEFLVMTGLNDGDPEILVNRCASFLRIQANKIEFVHQSARDYLRKESSQSIFELYTGFGHHEISLGCLFQLHEHLKLNLLDLPQPDSTRNLSESLKEEEDDQISRLDYAANFWVLHLANVDQRTINKSGTLEKVKVFLHTKLLEWFECLSLLGTLSLAAMFLELLGHLIQYDTRTSEFVRDALRFLLRHFHTIKHWPLQLYSSAIIFSPESSIVRRKNLDKVPGYLRLLSPMENSWSSLIQILEGHSEDVTTVAFSSDDRWIASGSKDCTVKLWSLTGSLEITLEGHSDDVTTVAFSSDNKWIVSGSKDCTVKLWSLTGSLERTLEGHSDDVTTVAFSPDDKWIVSGSRDSTIILWSLTGYREKTLWGHVGVVNTVAFSPDGKRIASGSSDYTVKIWSLTGSCIETLWGHSGDVNTVTFSPGGKRIASGSSDNTVKIWGLTGTLKKTHWRPDMMTMVRFSPDAKKIVSGSWDSNFKIWDLTGAVESTMKYSGLVISASFSHDSKRIASGSGHDIKIWNTEDDPEKRLNEFRRQVKVLEFSPNGKQLASGSDDNTIILWDAATGEAQRTLQGHSSKILGLSFSPDGNYVASSSSDYSIRIWDTATGELKKTLDGYRTIFTAISFLSDGIHLMSGSSQGNIMVWNTTTGEIRGSVKGHTKMVMSLENSPCGSHIASGSADRTVQVWDVAEFVRTPTLFGLFFGSRSKFGSIEQIETHSRVSHMKFSADGKYLRTEDEPITPQSVKGWSSLTNFSSDLFIEEQWIKCGDISCLRLPGGYEPSVWDAKDDQVAIGLHSGQCLLLDIRQSCVRSMFEQNPGARSGRDS